MAIPEEGSKEKKSKKAKKALAEPKERKRREARKFEMTAGNSSETVVGAKTMYAKISPLLKEHGEVTIKLA